MTDKDVESQLREFLEWEERCRREGKTIEALHEKQDSMMRALRRVAKDRLEDKSVLARHGRAIKTLQHQVGLLTEAAPNVADWRADPSEITGRHDIRELAKSYAELEERLDEDEERKRESGLWWKRQGWIWAIAVLTILIGTAASGCVSYIFHRIESSESHRP